MLNEFIDHSFQEWFKKEFGRDYLSHNENDGRIKKAFFVAVQFTMDNLYIPYLEKIDYSHSRNDELSGTPLTGGGRYD